MTRQIAILLAFVFFSHVRTARADVELELTIIDSNFRQQETPVANKKVWLIPQSGVPRLLVTDRAGRVRFSFPETPYVSIRVGSPPSSVQLPKMSGRFNQKTSLYVGLGTAKAQPSRVDPEICELIEDLRDLQSHGPLSEEIKSELRSLRQEVLSATEPFKGDSPTTASEKVADRQRWLTKVDLLIRGPWKLGVTCQYSNKGATIKSVVRGSPADQLGLKPGCIIVAVDDIEIGSEKDSQLELNDAFAQSEDGKVKIKWQSPSQNGKASSIYQLPIQLE